MLISKKYWASPETFLNSRFFFFAEQYSMNDLPSRFLIPISSNELGTANLQRTLYPAVWLSVRVNHGNSRGRSEKRWHARILKGSVIQCNQQRKSKKLKFSSQQNNHPSRGCSQWFKHFFLDFRNTTSSLSDLSRGRMKQSWREWYFSFDHKSGIFRLLMNLPSSPHLFFDSGNFLQDALQHNSLCDEEL